MLVRPAASELVFGQSAAVVADFEAPRAVLLAARYRRRDNGRVRGGALQRLRAGEVLRDPRADRDDALVQRLLRGLYRRALPSSGGVADLGLAVDTTDAANASA